MMPNQMSFLDVKKNVEGRLDVPYERQRYWMWTKRLSQTIRLFRVLRPDEELQKSTVSQLQESAATASVQGTLSPDSALKLFPEVLSDDEAATLSTQPATGDPVDDAARAGSVEDASGHIALLASPIPQLHVLLIFKFYDPRTETSSTSVTFGYSRRAT